MKFVGSQLAYYMKDRDFKRNSKILLKYLIFLTIIICLYSVIFHVIMEHEGQDHSWITGFYWTFTVMSTLGFGDITFQTDLGRVFSILVLITGIIALLIVLPFAFIRHFYVPLLESKDRNRVPRQVPSGTKDHVLICAYDTVAEDLIERLEQEGTPYFIIEPDLTKALEYHDRRIPVIRGDLYHRETFRNANTYQAKLVLVNREDTVNTKIILVIRQGSPDVPIIAIATDDESVDVLQLSGADHVLPIKRWLGEQLANRVNAQHARSRPIGQYEDLFIAELPVNNTPLVSKTVKETELRQKFGVSVVAIWKKGRMRPIKNSQKLTYDCVLVIIGSKEQLDNIDELFHEYDVNPNPVLVIGGGRVGFAAIKALHKDGIPVNLVEMDPAICKKAAPICNEVFPGTASDYDLLKKAGILKTPSVILSTHDDTMNIFLASYCRQLHQELKIVSRISEVRNMDIMHRAGANFVLSYAALGSEAVLAISKDRELTVLGEGIALFIDPIPPSLQDKTLAESGIGAKTGLSVIAIKENGEVSTQMSADTLLPPDAEIVMLGTTKMRDKFNKIYGNGQ
ncbi:NAD-binding protein [Pricia sp. S334]|uniref:NAD-binding protein n=1 Tax=Pricia mediterranea TaxID=3076079 RepID=A0ABU3LB54_9FLAO|nr:NAD-binding protein [Pricia sp. S334]MDT7830453.1 NAD-binding protein [Pricia sp. S334]